MEKILISSIVRNRENTLDNYFLQIEKFIQHLSDNFKFSISIYENDSIDSSKEKLENYDYSSFEKANIICEDIGTPFFGSVIDEQRVINFAKARNETIKDLNLNEFDWLLIIEPDVIYDLSVSTEIITRKQLQFNPDVYSGVLRMGGQVYDKWGMRRDSQDDWGDVMSDYLENPIKEFWTTANGICLYNMEPFKKGLKFSAFNKRLNKYDCDTAVLCEDFREMGYNKIIINQLLVPTHPIR